MIGDLSREKGQQTCQDLQREFGRSNAAFYHVDVTNPANLEGWYLGVCLSVSSVRLSVYLHK